MAEEGTITMNEFKTVVERFEENQKKIVEVMNHRFDQQDKRFDRLENRMGSMENRMGSMENRMTGMMEQIALLHEGQTEIKAELRQKADNAALSSLEKRVVRLETRAI